MTLLIWAIPPAALAASALSIWLIGEIADFSADVGEQIEVQQ